MIYLLLELSRPVSLKKEIKEDEDSDYEEEFDRIRDPNIDMMFWVKKAPKMKRIRDVDYEIDQNQGAAEYLFADRDAPSFVEVDESEFDDAEIDKFTDNMSVAWGGEEESQLRMAVFVAFVNNKDTVNLRKKTKKNRKEVIRRASRIGSVNDHNAAGLTSPISRTARRFSEFKKSVQSAYAGGLSPQNKLAKTGNFGYSESNGAKDKEKRLSTIEDDSTEQFTLSLSNPIGIGERSKNANNIYIDVQVNEKEDY